ncbi:MAG: NTP transferase domain-containing protein [Bacteroidetes bacterium]|nr:NTP transferase domain-containing protein [Bacteroidota bacterium]
MRAVIPVAGVGTRLRPHTYALPKVLLNVAGKPILSHIIDSLIQHSIVDYTIITGYKGDQVKDFMLQKYPNLNIDFVEQSERLGLGHAIWTGKDTYKDDEPIIIILGDTIFDVDLTPVLSINHNAIAVKKIEDPRRFGVVVVNEETKEIEKLVEKPQVPISNLAIVGIYCIQNTKKLIDSLQYLMDNNIRTKNEFQLTDALQNMLENDEKFYTFNVEGWYDCGKAETLLETNKFLLEKNYSNFNKFSDKNVIIPPCFISENAIVENSIIGPYASVAENAVVKNSIINNSIISNNAKVTKILLRESIIGDEAEIAGTYNKLNIGNASIIELE